jgi:hypothetical protein
MIRFLPVGGLTAVALAGFTLVAPAYAQPVAAEALTTARTHCLTAVAKVVGRPHSSLKVIHQTSDASGISTDVQVPEATAAWGCLTDRQGIVKDVHFKGSEGAL